MRSKREGDPPRYITMPEAVEEWQRLGYTVDGPFVLEADDALAKLLRGDLVADHDDGRALRGQ